LKVSVALTKFSFIKFFIGILDDVNLLSPSQNAGRRSYLMVRSAVHRDEKSLRLTFTASV
jgi:hypothetical protein